MNYEVTKQWQTLSDNMGEEYDLTKQYRIHNNVDRPLHLFLTTVENPTDEIKGSKYPLYADIYAPAGQNSSLRVLGWSETFGKVSDVEISEVI